AVKRLPFRGEEHGHGPAAMPRHPLHGRHVERVDVRPLLSVYLDVDEAIVHDRRRILVLERFSLHHVAPVTGGVADRQEDGAILRAGAFKRLVTPRVPVDRVVLVLEQVGAGFPRQAVDWTIHYQIGVGSVEGVDRSGAAKGVPSSTDIQSRHPGLARRSRWTGPRSSGSFQIYPAKRTSL